MSTFKVGVTTLNNETNGPEDIDFGKVTGRKRDLRWKTFRQTISEESSIVFHSKPDTTKLNKDFLTLIEEKCGDGGDQHNLKASQNEAQSASNRYFQCPIPESQGSPSVLASCKNNTRHRLEFASNQIDRDITLLSVLADTNVGYAHGFGSEAFSVEEARQVPDALTLTNPETSTEYVSTQKSRLYCPYLFFNIAYTSARHDVEWTQNRCALDGSSALQALNMLQQTLQTEEGHYDTFTLFSCAMSHNWAILNHHWILGGKLCMAPLCKFDLRDHSHTVKFQAWIEAIGKWAEVQLLPYLRQTLKTLSEWDEVMNDPLNTTPAHEFGAARAGGSVLPDRINHVRQFSDIGPARRKAALPSLVPATSIGLYFPESTYESTQRILSWRRDASRWQDGPHSASFVPDRICQQGLDSGPYCSLDRSLEASCNQEELYTSQIVPSVLAPSSTKPNSQLLPRIIFETCNSDQQRLQHEPSQRQMKDSRSINSRKTSSTTCPGVDKVLRHSRNSQDMELSLPLRSPLFQCHNADIRKYMTPPSSAGTRFEDKLTPNMQHDNDCSLSHGPDVYKETIPHAAPNDVSSTYRFIEEWAQQQTYLLANDRGDIVFQGEEPYAAEIGQKDEPGSEKLEVDCRLLLQPDTVSPVGNDRASVTLWINRILEERMICVE